MMKKYLWLLVMPMIVLSFTSAVLAEEDCDVDIGCSEEEPGTPEFKVESLTYDEFMKIRTDQKLKHTLVDVRPESSYNRGHIKGAKSLFVAYANYEDIQALLPNKDEVVIVYCASSKCKMSHYAATKLMSIGYKNVYDYNGGMYEWMMKGHPAEVVETATEPATP